jgi:hypothetical protein
MPSIRRRSWVSGRQPRKDGLRLSTMVVLLAVVVVLMFAASRPEIWVQLVPGLDSQAPTTAKATPPTATTTTTKSNVEMSPAPVPGTPANAPPAARQTDPTRLRLIGLIILAVVYFGWRFARMGRALRQQQAAKRARPGLPPPPSSPEVE